jgi:hypothetical protein
MGGVEMNYRRPLTVLLASSGILGLTMAWGANPPEATSQSSANANGGAAQTTTTDTLTPVTSGGERMTQAAVSSKSASEAAAVTTQPSTSAPAPNSSVLVSRNQINDPLSASVIDDAQLATARGGSSTNQNNATGTVAGNVASQLTTGSNTISSSAFSDSSGIPIVIQNTGNNVLIQNSTILNLQLTGSK